MSVIKDNIKPNDLMLNDFKVIVEEQFNLLKDREQTYFYYKFNRKDSDI